MAAGCKHRRLGFSQGGVYIQCVDCKDLWRAVRASDGEGYDDDRRRDGLYPKDLRVDPDLLELKS